MPDSCPLDIPGEPPFYQYGYDNSMGCWLSNYILSVSAGVYVGFLWQQASQHWADGVLCGDVCERVNARAIHIRGFLICKYLLLAISILVAGFVHHGVFGDAGYVDSGVNFYLWIVVEATLILSGGFTLCMASSFVLPYKVVDVWTRRMLFASILLAGVMLSGAVVAVYQVDAFALSGALGEFLPDLILLVVLLLLRIPAFVRFIHSPVGEHAHKAGHNHVNCQDGIVRCLWGIPIIFVGAVVQVGLGPACGTRCPLDCPLPAPRFDHNALFHLLQGVGMGILARGIYMVCMGLHHCPHETGYPKNPLVEKILANNPVNEKQSSFGSSAA